MEFLDEMLELRPTGTNLTTSRDRFESQRSPSLGPCQIPSLTPNPMHLPSLLQSSQEIQPRQSPPLTPNDETKPILLQTPSLEPGQTPSVSTMHSAPLLSQETQQPPSSQLGTSPSPPLTPNAETKPILFQSPSLGPVQTPSVSTMHVPPLSYQTTQPKQLPMLILTPSPGPGQTPSISTIHLPPLLQSSLETQPQQLPSQKRTFLSPSSMINNETKPILIQALNDTKQISMQMSNDETKPILIQTLNENTKPISIQMLNDDTKPISIQMSNDEDDIKPIRISIEMLSEKTKPISIEMLSEETKPTSVEMLSEDTKPISIQMSNDEDDIKPIRISIEMLSEETKPTSVEMLSEETKPTSVEMLSEDTKPISIQMSNDEDDIKPIRISIEMLSEETKPTSIEMLSEETKPTSVEMLSDETKPISIETPIDKRPHTKKRKNDCNVDDFGLSSTEKVLNYLRIKKQKTEWDSVEYLFMSYAKSFKQLSLRKQVKIKMALEKLIVESEKDESENKSMTLCRELDSHEDHFFGYFHMSRDSFEELHYLVRPYIQKLDTNYRKAIGSRERLAVCLRYIRTGNSFITIAYSFRIGRSTVSMIIEAVSKAIWECLQPVYMPTPTEATWKQSELGYHEVWNFPNCVGSVAGKHVMIQFSRNNGSMVLFAVADPFHNFIVIDVGSYGHPGDSNLFDNSAFYNQHLHNKKLLPPKPLPGTEAPVPHVLIGDEVFPLQTFLMRPFPAAASVHDPRKQTYNHRLSHARSVVENTFSGLTEKWRVFQRPLECNVEKAVHVIKAACCLHNFVRVKHGDTMQTSNATSSENSGPRSKKLGTNAFTPLRPTNIRSPNAAFAVREKFLEYFNQR